MLVAIAIPIFTTQLEKSREATDFANARSAYAELMVAVLDGETSPVSSIADVTFDMGSDISNDESTVTIPLNQKVDGWTTDLTDVNIAGVKSNDSTHWVNTPSAGGNVSVTFNPVTQVVTIDWDA